MYNELEFEMELKPVGYDYEVDCVVTFDYIPPIPAYLLGLPENCYPADGDEIDDIKISAGAMNEDNFNLGYVEREIRAML